MLKNAIPFIVPFFVASASITPAFACDIKSGSPLTAKELKQSSAFKEIKELGIGQFRALKSRCPGASIVLSFKKKADVSNDQACKKLSAVSAKTQVDNKALVTANNAFQCPR